MGKGGPVAQLDEKKKYILDNEYHFANRIAREVLQKPTLSIWMIVIPIVFVYYFYSLSRYAKAKKEFVRQFIITRKKLLDEAVDCLNEGTKPDFREMVLNEKVPGCAAEAYISWAKLLFEHYTRLLNTEGDGYISLIRNRYEDRGRFLLVLNQVNKAEGSFYKSLRKDLESSVDGSEDIISTMEKSLGPLRRGEADEAFGARN